MEQIAADTAPEFKIYKDKAIYGATFFGGPLAAGYIIAENFKAFGDNKKFKRTWIITISFTVFLFLLMIFSPNAERIPKYIIPLAYTIVAFSLIRMHQGKQIDNHIKDGGKTYSGWRVLLISIISLLITFIVFLSIILLIPEEQMETEYYPYNSINNEILYYPSKIDKSEVQTICEKLQIANFFDSTYAMNIYLDKDGKSYQVFVPYIVPAWNNPPDIEYYENLHKFIKPYFPKNDIEFIMCDSMLNIKRRIN